ncbi:uncharacterized protein LOC135388300 isoform X2 [Ornithodoros turicata]|uniref:uncharacterized protein LOC135388300 isoform X2 n=1 Tax=Ornithodoros turicata TaxID=34597 RepID=UPI003139DAC5
MKAVLVILDLLILCALHDCASGSYGPCTDIEGWPYELPPAKHGKDSDGCARTRHKDHHGAPEKNAQNGPYKKKHKERGSSYVYGHCQDGNCY